MCLSGPTSLTRVISLLLLSYLYLVGSDHFLLFYFLFFISLFVAFRVRVGSSSSGNSQVFIFFIYRLCCCRFCWLEMSSLFPSTWNLGLVLGIWYVSSGRRKCWFSEHWYFMVLRLLERLVYLCDGCSILFCFWISGIGFCGLPLAFDVGWVLFCLFVEAGAVWWVWSY